MQRLPPGMENVPARSLTINPADDWLAAARTFSRRLRSAIRAFGEALHKEPVRSPAMSRRQGGAQQPAPPPSPWMEPGELPETYGRTKVVAMVVSPYLVHVYWDLSAKDQKQSGPACLRFHDANAGGSFDVNVDLAARNWYVHLWSPEKRYSVELGLQHADSFQPLARSNPIETPRAWPVAEIARISDTPVQAPPLPTAQVAPPPFQPAPVLLAATAASATPPAPKSETLEGPSPSAQLPARPVPSNALETLRKRLAELYGFYRWPRPLAAAPEAAASESATSEEFVLSLLPETAVLEPQADLTDRLEARFSPGLSSSQLQDRNSRG